VSGLTLWDEAQALLDVATAALDTLPDEDASLAGAPLRRYINDGLPSYDCPAMLTVHVSTIGEFPIGTIPPQERVKWYRLNSVQFVLTCIRCRPDALNQAQPAPVQFHNKAGRQHLADGWAIWNGVWRAINREQLFSKCDGVEIVGAVADDPNGGASGWVFRFSPIIGGYDPIPDYVAPTSFDTLLP
jgi:hypothetical protein